MIITMIWKTYDLKEKNLTNSPIKLGHLLKIMSFACPEYSIHVQ